MSRDRTQPRSSITKIAEYLVAGPARRRAILCDQKYPPAFKVAPYREAYPAMGEVLANGGDVKLLDAVVSEWRRRRPKTPFEAECFGRQIDALMAFRQMLAAGTFDGYTFAAGLSLAYIDVAGVELSVRPEALIVAPGRGALKLYLGKTSPLTPDVSRKPGSSSYAAAALHWWAETRYGADAKSCAVADVFAGQLYFAPARFAQRREDIAAGCAEAAAVWASIKPPRRAAKGDSDSAN